MRVHIWREDKNPAWKGDKVSRKALHKWLNLNYPRARVCEDCGKKGNTEYAFLHHPDPYTRNRDDYRELCRRCHMRPKYL